MGNCIGIFRRSRLTEPLIGADELQMYPVHIYSGDMVISGMYSRSEARRDDSPERMPRQIVLSPATFDALINGELE